MNDEARRVVADLLRDMTATPPRDAPQHTRSFGEVTAHRVRLDSSTTAVTTAALPDSLTVTVLLVQSGCLYVSSVDEPGVIHRFSPGDGAYLLGWRSYTVAWEHDSRLLIVEAPDTILRGVGVRADDRACRLTAADMIIPAVAFFGSLFDLSPDPSPIATYMLTQLCSEMVGSLFLETFGVDHEASGSDDALFQQASALLLARRSDPEFGPDSLAAALRVTDRKLRAVFRERGTTITAELRTQRVHLAVDMLTDPAYDPLAIDSIAAYSGFAGADTLRTAMRAMGLATPGQVRAASRAGGTPSD